MKLENRAISLSVDLPVMACDGCEKKFILMDVTDISVIGRSTQGVRLIRLAEDELVATVARVKKDEDVEDIDDETSEMNDEGEE